MWLKIWQSCEGVTLWTAYAGCICVRMPSGSYAPMCLCKPIVPLLAVLDPRLLLTEILAACSVWLPLIERPRRLKCRLPWRQLQTTALPRMCHGPHLFPPSVKNNFLSVFAIHWHRQSRWTLWLLLVGPGPPPKEMRSLILTLILFELELEGLKEQQGKWFNRRLCVHLCKQIKPDQLLEIKVNYHQMGVNVL